MSTTTKIEWATKTWSPLLGCEKVTTGCDNCYAIGTAAIRAGHPNPKISSVFAGLTHRGVTGRLDWTGEVRTLPQRLNDPLRWRKAQHVFVNSMSDLFYADVPLAFIEQVFAVMAVSNRHTFQILTKRHARMASVLRRPTFAAAVVDRAVTEFGMPVDTLEWPLPNVWLGVSVEDQKTADLRLSALEGIPAAVRWVSAEPLLGPVDLSTWLRPQNRAVDWVVVGGESGLRARPMHPDWARSLRDQCEAAGVPFFFKQWGEHLPVEVEDDPKFSGGRAFNNPRTGGRSAAVIRARSTKAFHSGATRPMRAGDVNGLGRMLDDDTIAVKVGKKAAGRVLDGRTWDQFPAQCAREAVAA